MLADTQGSPGVLSNLFERLVALEVGRLLVPDQLDRFERSRAKNGTLRVEPRVRKRRPKQFPVMKRPRAVLRKALKGKKLAA